MAINRNLVITVTISTFLLSGSSFAQTDDTYSLTQLQSDFKILRGVLEESHAGIHWYRGKKEMDNYFEEAYSSLQHEMTGLEYYRVIAPLISKIGCGHTWIAASEKSQEKIWKSGKVLPIKIKIIERRAYCSENNSLDSMSIKRGEEIVMINNFSIDSLIKLTNHFSSGDGFIETGRVRLLERVLNQFYTLYVGQPDNYELTVKGESGEYREVDIPAISLKESETISARRYRKEKKQTENISFQLLSDESIAVLKINQFADWKRDGKKIEFASELKNIFTKINSSGVSNLVIDVRDNGGGDEKLGLELFSYLTDKPFLGYKRIDFRTKKFKYRKYSNTSFLEYAFYKMILRLKTVNATTYLLTNDSDTQQRQPKSKPFKGKIFVLINGGSFSATSDFTALVRENKLASFIGEETGGSFQGNTSNFEFLITLPNTKIKVGIPVARYQTNVTAKNFGRGTMPDYQHTYSINDYLNNRDSDMDMVFKLVKNVAPAQSK